MLTREQLELAARAICRLMCVGADYTAPDPRAERHHQACVDFAAALAAPPASVNDGWTPEYITGALAKAYPQGGVVIECGDVIEFAHGDDAPQFQRLTHPAAIEDWNGKLRDRVRGIYKRAAAPAPVDARRDCTCTGTCRGASGLGPRWKCALETPAAAPAPAAGEAEQDARARAMREGA